MDGKQKPIGPKTEDEAIEEMFDKAFGSNRDDDGIRDPNDEEDAEDDNDEDHGPFEVDPDDRDI